MGILQCKSIFYYRYNLFTMEKLFLLKHFVLLCLFTSQTSPESCAIITLSADMFVCWQNALSCHSVETNCPSLCKLCPVVLSGIGDLCISLLENRSKLPHNLQRHKCVLARFRSLWVPNLFQETNSCTNRE